MPADTNALKKQRDELAAQQAQLDEQIKAAEAVPPTQEEATEEWCRLVTALHGNHGRLEYLLNIMHPPKAAPAEATKQAA